ncbi:sulfate/thiosulfate ABC transporter ATP-binding protein CysA [Rosenbergiella australiborealis]|uniref:Sulfate/thiosulfate ABC transporter ATP-binding protein CysA n=1 Tax=Rosenbergiella australiborealis TaxID=1544696 RepID=A0ABS5T5P0_9GAMM|nr:sulfate/thiosulfate ABC transporter ATP-binding protein CysA [Rosenbergiella australiborealis]MBT0727673.1 sulfate/thiosulfate ABC transporter ATP-binding protein CysA [Rosenbergiella australiborealis]
MSINIKQISKSFGDTQVLNQLSLDIPSGEMVALLGPSGSGKTTLLRIIAGLENQNSGEILFHGRDVSHVHARDRQVGFVFQHYALFRHMTVFDNIAFGLTVMPRKSRPSKAVIRDKVMKLLDMVQLKAFANRYPAQLSGGQKQRVALARALAVEPAILLLDEPFGALDAQVRKELRRWLRQLHEELKFTSVFVTHDQEEAMDVADHIVVMSQGNIEQHGTPQQVWQAPESRFVLEFLGEINRLPATVSGQWLQVGEQRWPLSRPYCVEGNIDLFLRPWELAWSAQADAQHRLPAKVVEVTPRGHFWQLSVEVEGMQLDPLSLISQHSTAPERGTTLYLNLSQARVYQQNNLLAPLAFD